MNSWGYQDQSATAEAPRKGIVEEPGDMRALAFTRSVPSPQTRSSLSRFVSKVGIGEETLCLELAKLTALAVRSKPEHRS